MHEDAQKLIKMIEDDPDSGYIIIRIGTGSWTPVWKLASIPLALGILHYVMATLTTEMNKTLEKSGDDRTDA